MELLLHHGERDVLLNAGNELGRIQHLVGDLARDEGRRVNVELAFNCRRRGLSLSQIGQVLGGKSFFIAHHDRRNILVGGEQHAVGEGVRNLATNSEVLLRIHTLVDPRLARRNNRILRRDEAGNVPGSVVGGREGRPRRCIPARGILDAVRREAIGDERMVGCSVGSAAKHR